MTPQNGQKTGYLKSDFRIFHLTNVEERDFQSHYHDFHKLLYFESGSVSYYVEGETYHLQPDDIVFVPAGEMHRPVIHGAQPYHRLILYISPDFFARYEESSVSLGRCFALCTQRNSHVLRFAGLRESRLYPALRELIYCAQHPEGPGGAQWAVSPENGARLYQSSVLLQFLFLLDALSGGADISFPPAARANRQVLQALSYIGEHLRDELSIERVAGACYLNPSYFMHLFRRETGYTVGAYITEKRLFAARTLIQSGVSVTEACLQSGFASYAAFYRAYRKKFGEPPKQSRT